MKTIFILCLIAMAGTAAADLVLGAPEGTENLFCSA